MDAHIVAGSVMHVSNARRDPAAAPNARPRAARARRGRLARRLGLSPTTQEVVRAWLHDATTAGHMAALDAGCGRRSQLRPFRERLSRIVGVDIHAPAQRPHWLDSFVMADLCRDADAFPPGSFDVAVSNFTIEHFYDPHAALRHIGAWLKPGGWLVITTVNRRHPFVDLYLSVPTPMRALLQPMVKRSHADAHPLVGACNTPRLVREALEASGYDRIEVATTSHLARAWRRTLPTRVLGMIGDLAAGSMPGRRSTITARARRVES